MAKRPALRLVVVWVVITLAVTVWVSAQTEDVSAGNAMLVGVAVATILTVVLARAKKKGK